MKRIPLFKPFIPPKKIIYKHFDNVLNSNKISYGDYVYKFENLFSKFINNKYCLSYNSGSSALFAALKVLDIGYGDEVITCPLTAEPTSLSISMSGAKIVWADIMKDNVLVDPYSIMRKITKKTKAVIVVHYSGLVANMKLIRKICNENKIHLIEDCAHSLGSKYDKNFLGNSNNLSIFSFQAIKHLTTLDGGMICCHNKKLYERLMNFRWFGLSRFKSRKKNNIKENGFKFELNNYNSALGYIQMQYAKKIVNEYANNGKYFLNNIKDRENFKLCRPLKNTTPTFWMMSAFTKNRSKLIRKLKNAGIESGDVHKRNDSHEIFKESKVKLPNLDQYYESLIHFPSGWWLRKKDKILITEIINSF